MKITESQLRGVIKKILSEHYSGAAGNIINKINAVLSKVGLEFGGGMETLQSTDYYAVTEISTGKIVAFSQREYERLSQEYSEDELVMATPEQEQAIRQVLPDIQQIWNGDFDNELNENKKTITESQLNGNKSDESKIYKNMKRTITESQLRNIIAESIEKILIKENNDIAEKARRKLESIIQTMDLDEGERYWLFRNFPLEPQEVLSLDYKELKDYIITHLM